MGNWKLLENNCRDYVIAVFTYLSEYPEMTEDDRNAFETKMSRLKQGDLQRFEIVKDYFLKAGRKFAMSTANELAALGCREVQNF